MVINQKISPSILGEVLIVIMLEIIILTLKLLIAFLELINTLIRIKSKKSNK